MLIQVDVDGVCGDLHSAWLARYNKDYHDSLDSEHVTEWAIHQFVKPQCGMKIYDYLKDPTLYDDVRPIDGALSGVQFLRSIGHTVIFVSSGFYPSKVKWLVEHRFAVGYPYKDDERWETVSDVVLANNKSLIHGDVLIDDYPKNPSSLLTVLLFDSPWNRDETRFARVHGWSDIIKRLKIL